MDEDGSVTRWIRRLKSGDEEAFEKVFVRYWPHVVAIARKKLGGLWRQAVDEEDVAQSAFAGFYHSLKKGLFPKLTNRQDLLGLLAVITARKAARQIEHQLAQKRSGANSDPSAVAVPTQTRDGPQSVELVPDPHFGPPEVFELSETYRVYVQSLPEELRPIAECYLAGLTHAETADRCGCSARTVERRVPIICEFWRLRAQQEEFPGVTSW